MWSSTTTPYSILDELVKHRGEKVLLSLDTSGAARILGELKSVFHDGLVVEVASPIAGPKETKKVFVMLSAVASIELVKE